MGSAVSAVTNVVGGAGSNPFQQVGGLEGQMLGGAVGGVTSGLINGIIPEVPIADQSNLQSQINASRNQSAEMAAQQTSNQGAANVLLNESRAGINQTQGAINNAQQVNTGPNSNVQNSLGLVAQTAAGGGPAQQAASAQLQRGTDQAIASQHALANSGNLSQQISGQKTAMDNAASLNQQSANQASTLQADMANSAQQNYTGASAQQATTANNAAALQQQNAAQSIQLQGNLSNAAQGYASQQNTANNNAITGQTNALGIQQQALGQTSEYRAKALGGLMNAGGSILGLSDENSKTDIEPISAGDDNNPDKTTTTDKKPKTPFTAFSELGSTSYPKFQIVQSDEDSKTDIQYASPKDKAKAISSSFGTKPVEDVVEEPKPKPKVTALPYSDRSKSIKDSFLSDENTKKDISKDDKIAAFLDAIDPVSFKYKEPTGEMGKTPGEHIGVIAQQIEKAPGGASMIVETPEGKGIDLASAVGTLLAAAAQSHQRIEELEDLFKHKKEKK